MQQHRPDVVLLDIGMLGMDGHQVCRQIRRELGVKPVDLQALSALLAHCEWETRTRELRSVVGAPQDLSHLVLRATSDHCLTGFEAIRPCRR